LCKLSTFVVLAYIHSSLVKEEEKVLEGSGAGLREYIHNKLFEVFLKEIP